MPAGKGHKLGPPQIWAWGGLIAGLQKQEASVGAVNAATLTGNLKQLDGTSMDTKCDDARFCRVDRTYQSEQARITLAVDRSGVRDPGASALQQLGGARKCGRAPPTQLSRELQQWLGERVAGSERERDQPSKLQVLALVRSEAVLRMAMAFKGEHRVSFSARVSCFSL